MRGSDIKNQGGDQTPAALITPQGECNEKNN